MFKCQIAFTFTGQVVPSISGLISLLGGKGTVVCITEFIQLTATQIAEHFIRFLFIHFADGNAHVHQHTCRQHPPWEPSQAMAPL